MEFLETIKNAVTTVAASIREAARMVVRRYKKWRELLRQRAHREREHSEYLDELLATTFPYHPEKVDMELAEECRLLIKRFFPHGVEPALLEIEVEERIKLLERFTGEVARLMDIRINDLKFFTSGQSGNNCCGFYNHNEKLMAINIDYVACDSPEIMRDVVNTILHECKHSRQHFAIVEGIDYGYSKGLLEQWYRNVRNYIVQDESDEAYRKQPMELDSFGFANSIIKA